MIATDDAQTALLLLHGLIVTVELASIVLALGVAGGLVFAAAAQMGGHLGRWLTTLLLLFTRGIPLLVQVFVVFYVLPAFGLTLGRFATATIALSLFASVTIGEIIRGGIASVAVGQTEASAALGLRRLQVFRLIILPQAVRYVLPGLVSQFVFLIKATSIISLLGVPELMLSAREVIERTLEGLKVMGLVWVFYTAICLPLSVWARSIERRSTLQTG